MESSSPPQGARGKCPICGRPTQAACRPFCSRRCADIDLSRWLRGAYAIPDQGDSEDGDEANAGSDGAGQDVRGDKGSGGAS